MTENETAAPDPTTLTGPPADGRERKLPDNLTEEMQLELDLARPAAANLSEWRELLDHRDNIEALLKPIKGRIDALKYWAIKECERTGQEKFSHTGTEGIGLTVSVKDKVIPTYDPALWDESLVAMVGVSLHPAELDGLVEVMTRPSDNLASPDEIEGAIRNCLSLGNLSLLNKGLGARRIEAAIVDGVELPEGIGVDTIRSVTATRIKA